MATPEHERDYLNDEHYAQELRDLEARLREGAMRMLMGHAWCDECACLTNHDGVAHRRAEERMEKREP